MVEKEKRVGFTKRGRRGSPGKNRIKRICLSRKSCKCTRSRNTKRLAGLRSQSIPPEKGRR